MRRVMLAAAVTVLCALGTQALVSGQTAAPSDRIDLDLYWEYEVVSDPQVSPDGNQIVYTRQFIDRVNDKRESALWVMNADGTKNRFLVRGSNARWSPTGDRILYTAQGDPKGTQIFVRYMDAEGATSQVTRVEKTPATPAWSPDGTAIAFTMMVEEKNAWPIKMPRAPEGAKWTETPRIVERLDYRQDGQGFTDDGYRHLFVVPSGGGTARRLTDGNWDHNGAEWTPDGTQVLFTSLRVPDAEYQWRDSDIYGVNVGTGAIAQLTRRKGPDANPKVSPDGKRVAYTGYDWTKDTWIDSKVYVMDIDGSNPRLVSGTWDRSPQNLQWKADGSGVYFNAQDQGSQNLYFLPLAGTRADEVQAVTRGTQMLTATSFAKGKGVGVLTSALKPPDIVSWDLAQPDKIRQLTFVNDDILTGRKLGSVSGDVVLGARRHEDPGLVHHAAGFRRHQEVPDAAPHPRRAARHVRRRLQLRLAGDGRQRLRDSLHEPARQHRLRERLRQSDHACLPEQGLRRPDGRGGRAAEEGLRRSAQHVRHRLQRRRRADGVDRGQDRSLRGRLRQLPRHRLDQLRRHHRRRTWYYNFEKLPWEDPSEHIRRSPLTYVANVKTPTMLMTGVQDLRTPMPQTEQFYSALKLLKVPTAMVRFNNEWHGTTTTPSNFVRTQLYLRYWFDRFKRTEGTTTTAQR